MQALDAIKLICKAGAWDYDENMLTYDVPKVDIAFDEYTLSLYALNTNTLILSCILFELPQDESAAYEILKKGATMTASVWQDHKVNFSLHESNIVLELNVNTQSLEETKLINYCQTFLDDCDFFIEHLYSKGEDNNNFSPFSFLGVNP